MLLSRKDPKTSLLKLVDSYWKETAYIIEQEMADRMRDFLTRAQEAAQNGDLQTARDAFYQAKREYIIARKCRQIYYSRSWPGMLISLFLLILFGVGTLLIFTFPNIIVPLPLIIIAALGGGIGGCVAVLLQVIQVDPSSEVVSKVPWYYLKPSLGLALGAFTYMGVSLGIDLLASNGSIDSREGAAVVGFLAGFFESFSTGVLSRIAGQHVGDEQR